MLGGALNPVVTRLAWVRVGFCEYCSHEWPLDFWELEETLEMTKPLPS